LYYNPKPSGRGYKYADAPGTPLFPFGHGLSYTSFKYSGLTFSPAKVPYGESVAVSLEVENTGKRAGDEVVQLYLRDLVASMAQPLKRLVAFKRVSLKPGEKKRVSFVLTPRDLSFLDQSLKWRLEPGAFKVMVGSSSSDIRLDGGFSVANP
jgi:beta-glucosidase